MILNVVMNMGSAHLILFLIGTNICLAYSTVINPHLSAHTKGQRRTWDEAIAMAKAFTAQLSLEQKCKMTAGIKGPCAGNIPAVPNLNFSGLCFQDTPSGVGDAILHSTAFPAGIHIAATFDRDLFYRRAAAIGEEFQGKGVSFALGPMMNIDRNARHGRNWEGFGSDPYLSGENSLAYVLGVQDQGVVATPKHYICNEQETHRVYDPSDDRTTSLADHLHAYSAYLDDKTMHEVYLWPFALSIAVGAGSVMCSYNQVNGTPACQNDQTLNGLLKNQLEYAGNVMSDWGATKSGVPSVLAGLDIDMPGSDGFMGDALIPAVQNGTIPQGRIDDMVVRIVAPYYLLGQDQGYPTVNLDRKVVGDHYKINRLLSAAGMILLKNVDNILPFNITKDDLIQIYGQAAGQDNYGLDTRGLSKHAGAMFQGGGSGFVQSTYAIDPLSSLLMKGRDSFLHIRFCTNQDDYGYLNSTFQSRAFNQSKCLVFVSAFSAEGSDRTDLHAMNDGDKLVQTVAANCPNTVVIVNSVSQLNLEAWIDLPNVKGVLWTGMPGAEYGPALVDVLFGDYNPGGKLVFTLAKNDSDYGTDIDPDFNSTYAEGVFLDYRHFDKFNITPRFAFGYGLSYTTFSFTQLDIAEITNKKNAAAVQYKQRRTRSYSNFGSSGLYEPVYQITFTLTNTGTVSGSEVPQLYLGFPAEAQEPFKILRGFERVYLDGGESKQVTLLLTQKDISYWNVMTQTWTVASGDYKVWISTSASNDDIKLQGSFHK